MQLDLLMGGIARNLIADARFMASCELARIDFTDWPQSPQRQCVELYLKARREHSHDYAALKTFEMGERFPEVAIPDDPDLLSAMYFKAIRTFRGLELAQKIRMNPESADKIISDFKGVRTHEPLAHFGLKFKDYIANVVRRAQDNKTRIAIPDWPELSDMIGGFNPGRVGMLVAKTGFGKTTCSINLALSASKIMPTVYLNMEMSEQDFAERLICAEGNLNYKEFTRNVFHYEKKLEDIMERVYTRPFFFSHGVPFTVQDIYATANEYKLRYGLGLLIVDYDQKIALKTSKDTPEWKALQIALEGLDELSRRLDCFILVLAQESASGDVSGSQRSKFPTSSVLRFYESEKNLAGQSKYVIEALKNRFGPYGAMVEVEYDAAACRVREIGQTQSKPSYKDRLKEDSSPRDTPRASAGHQRQIAPARRYSPSD